MRTTTDPAFSTPRPNLLPAPHRVTVDLRGCAASPLISLRTLLVADVLQRVLEYEESAPALVVIMDGAGVEGIPKPVVDRLGLAAAPRCRSDDAAASILGGEPTVTVAPTGRPQRRKSDGPVIPVGDVQPERWDGKLPLLVEGRDPFNLRLALLHFPHAAPAILTAARLHRADETLERWRFKVSYWKDRPEAPAQHFETLMAPLAGDLDTGSVLRAMHRMEGDHTIPSGAKYEAFAELDGILALDLRRRCGLGHW